MLRTDKRDLISSLHDRIWMLRGMERAIFSSYFDNGIPVTRLALLTGRSESSIRRNLVDMSERLLSSRYTECVKLRNSLEPAESNIAAMYFRDGKSKTEISRSTGRTNYFVNATVIKLESMVGRRKKKSNRNNIFQLRRS